MLHTVGEGLHLVGCQPVATNIGTQDENDEHHDQLQHRTLRQLDRPDRHEEPERQEN